MDVTRTLRFSKMHGAGNDFMVLDLRGGLAPPAPGRVQALANRHTGIGFDQLLTIEDGPGGDCAAGYRIWNGDGSPARQCGNGARCVAAWLHREGAVTGRSFALDSPAGRIEVERLDDGRYALGMGRPDFDPVHVPFAAPAERATYQIDLELGETKFGAVSMGNPHAVIEVASADEAPVNLVGPAMQDRLEFPEGVNVGFAQLLSRDRIRLRVFERGAGETLACGSGACAAVAVLVRQERVDRHVLVELPGGTLEILWPADDQGITMSGPVAFVYEGEVSAAPA